MLCLKIMMMMTSVRFVVVVVVFVHSVNQTVSLLGTQMNHIKSDTIG